jgi:hemerythrin-like metal-binding protein
METCKSALIWNDVYSVGVQEIDEQHKKLVEILNELIAHSCSSPGSENLDIKATIGKIVEYKTVHFETEEKYFKQFNFEGSEEHIQKHREFNERVGELLSEFQESGGKSDLSELVDFMESWFIDHLLHLDQKYVKCFQENGLK